MQYREPEIRRHRNGSIDIDHYIRRCHRRRSLAAHKAIGRFLARLGAPIEGSLEGYGMALGAEEREATSGEACLSDPEYSPGQPERAYRALPPLPSRRCNPQKTPVHGVVSPVRAPVAAGAGVSGASRQTLQPVS
jgi:hypothetical protein